MIVPGGGTGGGTNYLAEQLNHTNAEVVYIDFSVISMDISKNRAKVRQLSNVIWITDWIESIPLLGMGCYDLVVCTGVIHHMKMPQKGLRIVNEIQTEHGGANIMVYGKYGRLGIYTMQELMRIVNRNEAMLNSEISNARKMIKIFPRNTAVRYLTGDHITMGDIGIYDSYLHKRDVCYDIINLFAFTEGSGYYFVDFDSQETRIKISLMSRLRKKLLIHIENMRIQNAIAELIVGDINMQSFYISKQKHAKAVITNPRNNINLNGSPAGLYEIINNENNHRQVANKTMIFANIERRYFDVADKENDNVNTYHPTRIATFCWPLSDFNNFVLTSIEQNYSSKTTGKSLITEYQAMYGSNYTEAYVEYLLEDLYWYLELSGLFLLRHTELEKFPKTANSRLRLAVSGIA